MTTRADSLVGLLAVLSLLLSSPVNAVRIAEPVTVLLVLDAGEHSVTRSFFGSFPPDGRVRIARVIEREFISKLDPQDRVRIGMFGARLVFSTNYTSNRKELSAALKSGLTLPNEDVHGPSPIWDVVGQGVEDLAREQGRRAIVLFTDGEATANTRSFEDVAKEARDRSIPIHVVSTAVDTGIRQGNGTVYHSRPSAKLREIATVTGGLFLQAADAKREVAIESYGPYFGMGARGQPQPFWFPDPGKAFAQIAEQIHPRPTR